MAQFTAFAALVGHRCVGIERAPESFDLAERVRQHVLKEWPGLEERYKILKGWFPNTGTDYLTPETVVVTTNAYYRIPDFEFDALLEALQPARALVVSHKHFLCPERCPYERTDPRWPEFLLRELAEKGFKRQECVYEWPVHEYEFVPDRILCLQKS